MTTTREQALAAAFAERLATIPVGTKIAYDGGTGRLALSYENKPMFMAARARRKGRYMRPERTLALAGSNAPLWDPAAERIARGWTMEDDLAALVGKTFTTFHHVYRIVGQSDAVKTYIEATRVDTCVRDADGRSICGISGCERYSYNHDEWADFLAGIGAEWRHSPRWIEDGADIDAIIEAEHRAGWESVARDKARIAETRARNEDAAARHEADRRKRREAYDAELAELVGTPTQTGGLAHLRRLLTVGTEVLTVLNPYNPVMNGKTRTVVKTQTNEVSLEGSWLRFRSAGEVTWFGPDTFAIGNFADPTETPMVFRIAA